MKRGLRNVLVNGCALALALSLVACGAGNEDTETLGDNPYVTEEGTSTTFAQFEPGLGVMPLPNDLVWLADGDPEVELALDEDADPAFKQLAQVIEALGLQGLSPNMFLTVPVTGEVQADTVTLLAFRTDDPHFLELLGALAGNDLTGAGAALAQMEIRTEQDFFPVAGNGVLKLVPKTPLTPGAAYAVALKRTLLDANGSLVESSLAMSALKSQTPFGDDHPYARLEAIRARFNDPDPVTGAPGLLDIVAAVSGAKFGAAWTRDDILVAWAFHTAKETLSLNVTNEDPTDDTLQYPNEDENPFSDTVKMFRMASADWNTNNVMVNSRVSAEDYWKSPQVDEDGNPLPSLEDLKVPRDALGFVCNGSYDSVDLNTLSFTEKLPTPVYFVVVTPAPDNCGPGPYTTVLFQHGLGRSKEDAFTLANSLAKACLATLAIDAPFHGGRADENVEFFTANLLQDRANIYQAAIDLWEAMDVIGTIDLDGDEEPDLTNPRFVAHSLGSIIGSTFLAGDTRAEKVLLSSPSAGLANVLDETALPDIQAIVASLGYTKGTTEYYVFLNVVQWLMDPVDGAYMGVGENDANAKVQAVIAHGDPVITNTASYAFASAVGILNPVPVTLNLDSPTTPGTVSVEPGAYEFGVDGEGEWLDVSHSFLLKPEDREKPVELSAYATAQSQAAAFLAPSASEE